MTIAAPALTTPVQVGAYLLQNRIVLAPMTRLRASPDGVPAPFAAEYYAQRANPGGLLITEGTLIEEGGVMPGVPGIYTPEQIAAWKNVTAAVHAKGGVIFAQIAALGRVAEPAHGNATVWGPSSGDFGGHEVTALTEADIDRFVAHFARAALAAIEAGFDGVEIHGANGFLLDQFIQNVSNTRTDNYGGSVANRMRFPLRVVAAVADAIGPQRTAYRLSPFSAFQGMKEADPLATFVPFTRALVAAHPELAYVHVVEARFDGERVADKNAENEGESVLPIREVLHGTGIQYIAAGGITPASGEEMVQKHGGLVALGRIYLANPDLVDRVTHGWELNTYDRDTFYTPGTKGYTDYPTYDQSRVAATATATA